MMVRWEVNGYFVGWFFVFNFGDDLFSLLEVDEVIMYNFVVWLCFYYGVVMDVDVFDEVCRFKGDVFIDVFVLNLMEME